MNVVIRADGGNIGFGHVMRCSALGNALKKAGAEVVFAVNNDQSVIDKVRQMGFNTAVMGGMTSLSEIPKLCDVIRKAEADVLIVDSYNVSEEYFSAVKQIISKTIYIDDINAFPYDVDMVINGNVYAADLPYASPNHSTRFLLGSKYALLRDEFLNTLPVTLKPAVENILVTTGGTDTWRLTPRVLDCMEAEGLLDTVKVNVVIGPGFKNVNDIADKYGKHPNIRLHGNVLSMPALIAANDIAISAGGSTNYELAYMGVPALVISTADNQFMLAAKMHEMGAVSYIGYARDVTDEQIREGLRKLINDFDFRSSLARNCRRIIDGKGAMRCAEEIVKLVDR